jgi:hypothetical protein
MVLWEKVVHDYGLSKKADISLQGLLEEEWAASQHDAVKRLGVAQLASFVFLAYARALRGEEITRIELGGAPKHVKLSLLGISTKLEGGKHHFLPVVELTVSGIRVREWV